MNIEDITTDDDNRLILSDMKRNTEEDSQLDLWIQNEHRGEIEIDEEQRYVHFPDYVPEGAKDMRLLGYFIGKSSYLQSLNIRPFEPTSGASVIEVFESFLRGVNNNKSIRMLDFTNVDTFEGRVFSMLGPFFENTQNLLTLNVDECNLGEEGSRLLALAIGSSKHQSLRNVNLMNNSISDGGMVDIITSLSMHPRLQQIILSGNRLGRNGCMALATLLRCSVTELYHLDLGSNDLDDEGIDALVPVLSIHTKLQGIFIDNNTLITTRGWQHLATILEAPYSNLETLSINWNNIDDQVLTFFVDALAHNNTLVSLHFKWNQGRITDEGWKALSKLLCDTSSANSIFHSNHTLSDIDIKNQTISQDLRPFLRASLALNLMEDRKDVAMIKIYGFLFIDRNLDMTPFFEWEFKILPLMIDWLERVIACNDAHPPTPSEMVEYEVRHRSIQLSSIYQFVRNMPLLCVETQLRKQLDDINAELTFMLCPSCSILPQMEEESPGQRKRQLEARKSSILELLGRW